MVAEQSHKNGFAYLDIGLYHPPVYRFLEMRQELGVRNVFHPIARLLNPARASSQVVGLSHPPHFEKTAEALRMLGCPRALVIRGVEGDPELSDCHGDKSSGIAGRAHYAARVGVRKTSDAAGHATRDGGVSARISEKRKRICSGVFFTIGFRAGQESGC